MASEHGERVKLVGLSIGDQVKAFSETAASADQIVPSLGGIVLELEDLDAQAQLLSSRLGEVANQLVATNEKTDRNLDGTGSAYQRLEDASEAAHNLLEGTQSDLAQKGLDRAVRSQEAAEKAQHAGQMAKDSTEAAIRVLTTELTQALEGVHVLLGAAREAVVDAGESTSAMKETLTASAQHANAAKDDLVTYGDSL